MLNGRLRRPCTPDRRPYFEVPQRPHRPGAAWKFRTGMGDRMPAPIAETESSRPSAAEQADGPCGYEWTDDRACDTGSAHVCSRIRADHRSHLCSCQAVEMRTATHLRRSTAPLAVAAARAGEPIELAGGRP